MATITKRGDTFRIRTSCGYDVNGKQVVRSMTYKPQEGMTERQIDKEVQRQAVLFEEGCKQGQSLTAAKFETFAREWFKNYAEIKLKAMTIYSYHRMEQRTYAALGHIRVDKITPLDVQKFIRSLIGEGLAANSVKRYVRFVSVILNYAVRKRVALYNPCTLADLPQARETERDMYSVEEVRNILGLFRQENEQDRGKLNLTVFLTLAIYTGCRKGELLGLEWKDIDFNDNVIAINRASYYDGWQHKIITDTPKTALSKRSLKLPQHVIDTLRELREWQNGQRELCGGSWVECDRLFTRWNGSAMSPAMPGKYFTKFCKRYGIRHLKLHSFRHFNASVLINSGVDVKTVQTALGHSVPATTLNIYSHSYNTAQTRAMEAISSAIDF